MGAKIPPKKWRRMRIVPPRLRSKKMTRPSCCLGCQNWNYRVLRQNSAARAAVRCCVAGE
jgi:hypothetical protein